MSDKKKLTAIETDEQKREDHEMALVTKILAALDEALGTDDYAEADELIGQLKPKGALKSVPGPTKTG